MDRRQQIRAFRVEGERHAEGALGDKRGINVDKATLVKSDQDVLGRVILALNRSRIPTTLCDWNYVPQLDEWQLIIATPLYDSKGPHEAFSRVVAALQREHIYQEVPVRRLFVKSSHDPLVKALEEEAKAKTEWVIFIDLHQLGDSRRYSVVFSPFVGPGGAVPSRGFSGDDDLRDFLEGELHLSRSRVDETIWELDHKRHTWIPNVQLSKREAKKLGLA